MIYFVVVMLSIVYGQIYPYYIGMITSSATINDVTSPRDVTLKDMGKLIGNTQKRSKTWAVGKNIGGIYLPRINL